MVKLKVAELFAGVGGVTGGFLDAGGFEPVFLHDHDPAARATFVRNFPRLKEHYHLGCVTRLIGRQLLEAAGGEIDGLLGCPPCQGFSSAGFRDKADVRNDLLFDFLRLVSEVKPKFFVMENVPNLLSSDHYRAFRQSLSENYALRAEVLNAAEYGVPQLRRRAVAIGLRKDLGLKPSLPAPRHGGRGKVFEYCTGKYVCSSTREGRALLGLRPNVKGGYRKLITLESALGDLPVDTSPSNEPSSYVRRPTTPYQERMRRKAARLLNHRPWRHRPEMVARLERVAPGDCPKQYGGRSRNTRYFSQAYARLHRHGLARTITTNFHNPGSGRFTHYAAPRTLTLREALRVQGFPDDFHFDPDEVHLSDAERLVGNAFPRLLAQVLAEHIRMLFRI